MPREKKTSHTSSHHDDQTSSKKSRRNQRKIKDSEYHAHTASSSSSRRNRGSSSTAHQVNTSTQQQNSFMDESANSNVVAADGTYYYIDNSDREFNGWAENENSGTEKGSPPPEAEYQFTEEQHETLRLLKENTAKMPDGTTYKFSSLVANPKLEEEWIKSINSTTDPAQMHVCREALLSFYETNDPNYKD
ncbi:hypothetical protein CI109_106068 [Kwoniella shandongensis]|uniref:Uncharacterized protein n=1 Tax=Kwoniella shandongensis TaxID=1734106 RepID=A0A5M6BXM8_9TREE|nr:uncharacterized protein CI109_003877 [Kwoniella shandongensis]KAA5527618.1 hypothetical protein CI109_003877 [Kwoniella shandongensis]